MAARGQKNKLNNMFRADLITANAGIEKSSAHSMTSLLASACMESHIRDFPLGSSIIGGQGELPGAIVGENIVLSYFVSAEYQVLYI